MTIKDTGPRPQSFDIESATKEKLSVSELALTLQHSTQTKLLIELSVEV